MELVNTKILLKRIQHKPKMNTEGDNDDENDIENIYEKGRECNKRKKKRKQQISPLKSKSIHVFLFLAKKK